MSLHVHSNILHTTLTHTHTHTRSNARLCNAQCAMCASKTKRNGPQTQSVCFWCMLEHMCKGKLLGCDSTRKHKERIREGIVNYVNYSRWSTPIENCAACGLGKHIRGARGERQANRRLSEVAFKIQPTKSFITYSLATGLGSIFSLPWEDSASLMRSFVCFSASVFVCVFYFLRSQFAHVCCNGGIFIFILSVF